MANENIEDVIKKVILGEGFLAENAEEQEITEDEDTSDEGELYEEELDEAKDEDESEDEESEDEESEDEESEDEEEEEEDSEEEDSKGKKKMPAFLKGKFGKKGKSEEVKEYAEMQPTGMTTTHSSSSPASPIKKKVKPGMATKKPMKMAEAASDYASTEITHDVNKKGAKIAEPTGDNSGKNQATIKAKPSAAKAEAKYPEVGQGKKKEVKEDIDALFSGQELSEDFKTSAATLFEAHLNERVREIEEEVQAKYESLLEQHTVAVTEELVERIDDYLNYVVEEWMQENRLAVEQGLRTEITENFISNLRGLFAESYIEVPEEKLDLFESTVEEVESLDGELQEQVEKNIELSEEVEQLKCEIVFREIAEGLADTDVEKLRRLAEDLDFDTVEQFAEKVAVLRENIENIGTVAEEAAEEESLEESYEETSEASPLVEAFVRSMGKREE